MLAARGVVRGNTVLVDDAALADYEGRNVIITILNSPAQEADWGSSRKPGFAEGKFVCPDDIDEDNDQIARWFEGS